MPSGAAAGSRGAPRRAPHPRRAPPRPPTSRRSSVAAGGPDLRLLDRRLQSRLGAEQVDRCDEHRDEQDRRPSTMIVLPYDVCQSDASVGRCSDGCPDPGCEQHEHRNERDVREARHGDREARRRVVSGARLRQSTSSPTSPPTQIDSGADVQRVECERERAWGASAPRVRRHRGEHRGAGGEQSAAGVRAARRPIAASARAGRATAQPRPRARTAPSISSRSR